MNRFPDTQSLFAQLAAIPAEGAVKTLIENHDAWTHNMAAFSELNAILRGRVASVPRAAATQSRIATQRHSLSPLVTRLPSQIANAS